MKKIFLLLFVFTLLGCEKDDICADETTPLLVIEFYDDSNPINKKNVTSLKVTEAGRTDSLSTFSGVSTIKIPLKNMLDMTKYSFILNSTSITGADNEDFLQFNYTRQEVYVSRACGYKTIYQLNAADGVILTDAETPDELWMKSINIQTNTIETGNEVHIKIYF